MEQEEQKKGTEKCCYLYVLVFILRSVFQHGQKKGEIIIGSMLEVFQFLLDWDCCNMESAVVINL